MKNEADSVENGKTVIYVAGNPSLYPLEYYDPETETYQGAIPAFLEQFAQEYGYTVTYYQPGPTDRRADLAANQQVDLISGCTEGDSFAHTSGGGIPLFQAEDSGETISYQLRLTRVAPASFQKDLREFAEGQSQEVWSGALLTAAEEPPPSQTWLAPLAAGLGIAVCLLLAALLLLLGRQRRKGRQAQAARLTDPVTGIGTEARLAQVFSHSLNEHNRILFCLIYFRLDLDHIGQLGGYGAEKDFRQFAAQTLQAQATPADTLAQTASGDLVVLKMTEDVKTAQSWTQTVLRKLKEYDCAGYPLNPQDVTAGIYPLKAEDRQLDAVLFHARQCALAACREGNECRVCGTEHCKICQEERQLLLEVSRGLEQQEFQLYLQFFVDAHSFQIVGGEALSRWNHPQLGVLSPGRFIPLLEREGRVSLLDFYSMERSCAFLEELAGRQTGNFFVSCNFSRQTFSSPDFVKQCSAILERYAFDRKLLILEVTETQRVSKEGHAQMQQNIMDVRALGVRVIFDDFGMGFSSFHDLQEYPMDGLKLDKYLVDHMWTPRGKAILGGLVQTGHALGLTILAEGVESDQQVEVLRQLHCDVLQGYRFSVPVPADEAKRQIWDRKQAD